MPKGYEEIRDKFMAEGMSEKEAKTRAAKIWNSTHKGKSAVHGHMHEAFRKLVSIITEAGISVSYPDLQTGQLVDTPVENKAWKPDPALVGIIRRGLQRAARRNRDEKRIVYSFNTSNKKVEQSPLPPAKDAASSEIEDVRREEERILQTPKEKK